MNKDKIYEIVINQVNELVDTMPDDQKFEVSKDTILFGNNSNIDSLSLVSLIVDLEGLFAAEHNIDLSLTDDRAMTREQSPFDNITTLVDYIDELVSETKNS